MAYISKDAGWSRRDTSQAIRDVAVVKEKMEGLDVMERAVKWSCFAHAYATMQVLSAAEGGSDADL